MIRSDISRCRGRAWPEDTFLAPECQTCERWVAHYCDDTQDVTPHVDPSTERECPLRVPVAAPVFPKAPEISEADVPY